MKWAGRCHAFFMVSGDGEVLRKGPCCCHVGMKHQTSYLTLRAEATTAGAPYTLARVDV